MLSALEVYAQQRGFLYKDVSFDGQQTLVSFELEGKGLDIIGGPVMKEDPLGSDPSSFVVTFYVLRRNKSELDTKAVAESRLLAAQLARVKGVSVTEPSK